MLSSLVEISLKRLVTWNGNKAFVGPGLPHLNFQLASRWTRGRNVMAQYMMRDFPPRMMKGGMTSDNLILFLQYIYNPPDLLRKQAIKFKSANSIPY